MGLLIFALRKQELIRHKSQVEYRLLELSQKLQDLQNYASAVGSGPISLNSLMNVPPSLFGRMTSYMAMSNQVAMAKTQYQFNTMMSMPGAQQNLQAQSGGNAQVLQYQENMMKNQMYQNSMQDASKQEQQLLNAQEERITSEKTKLEEQAKMIDAEMEGLDKGEESAIKQDIPKYA